MQYYGLKVDGHELQLLLLLLQEELLAKVGVGVGQALSEGDRKHATQVLGEGLVVDQEQDRD